MGKAECHRTITVMAGRGAPPPIPPPPPPPPATAATAATTTATSSATPKPAATPAHGHLDRNCPGGILHDFLRFLLGPVGEFLFGPEIGAEQE